MKKAFSLVELSIVLVILGLLVGGVLAGQSLIRASELRAVGAEHDRYRTAVYAFRDKYFALPGDMTNATSFWGDQATGTSACASAATADGAPGTCNGDGSGLIGAGSTAGSEGVRAWQHLQMGGLIEGTYTGYYNTKLQQGSNVPVSKMKNGGWVLLSRTGGNAVWGINGNFLQVGSQAGLDTEMFSELFKPEEAWNVDTKLDDGQPETGRVLGDTNFANCVTPNAYSNTAPAGRPYKLDQATAACILYFKL